MKKLTMALVMVAAMVFAGRAAEVWTLDDSAEMPGSFWTITSPDGKWKLTCVPTDKSGVWEDSEGSADLAVVNDYSTYDREIETGDVFGSRVVDGGCVLKGSGVLRLPTHARDKKGVSHTVEIGNWSLEGWNAPVRKMTKCVVPADYTEAIGEGTSITADFEVESGNPKYYSRDGALYLRERYRGDEADGDVLLQCPSGKTGSFAIPDNVTKVRSGAFEMSSLSEIVIGPSLEVFESDHEVKDETMKKVTISGNDRFKFVNGFFLGDGGDTVLMVLKSFMKGDVVVPSCVKKIDVCAMAYQEKVGSFVFSSPELQISDYGLHGGHEIGALDFSAVRKLKLAREALVDGCAKKIYFPEDIEAPNGIMLDCFDDLTDVYWPTKMSLDEAEEKGIVFQLDEDCRPFTLHVRRDAGYWPERVAIASSQTMKVVKDIPVEGFNPGSGDVGSIDSFYGPFVPGEKVSLTIPALVGYTAKKLPSGLKLNKKTGEITGAAKKPTGDVGVTVTFTKKNEPTLTAQFAVGPIPAISVTLEGDTEKCKVTGANKAYLVGKKVTLQAKGPKGTAFVGWFRDGAPWPSEAEYLEPKIKYVMTKENLNLVARFKAEEVSVVCDTSVGCVVKVKVSFPVIVECESGLKSVSAKKLPSGLKYNKKTGCIEGAAKKAGTYPFSLTVTTKAGSKVTQGFTLVVREAAVPVTWWVGTYSGVAINWCDVCDEPPDCGPWELNMEVSISANGTVAGKLWDDGPDYGILKNGRKVSENGETSNWTVELWWYEDGRCEAPSISTMKISSNGVLEYYDNDDANPDDHCPIQATLTRKK